MEGVKKIPLVECFGPTVQGEGAVIGQQTYFLRFGLCDFKCRMCDSMHAVDPFQVKANAKWLTQSEIFNTLLDHKKSAGPHSTSWVTYSGGNPCIHDLGLLTTMLLQEGWQIAVETQGTYCPNWLLGCNIVTVSPKGPGMGEDCNLDELDEFVYKLRGHPGLNMKIVLFDERDLEFAALCQERYVQTQQMIPEDQFFLSLGNPFPPGMDVHPGADNSGRSLRDRLILAYEQMLPRVMSHVTLSKAKFLPQWHVILWGNKQGV